MWMLWKRKDTNKHIMADERILGVNILLMCFLINYYIGSNNTANSWGSAYCTQCVSISTAVNLPSTLAPPRWHL